MTSSRTWTPTRFRRRSGFTTWRSTSSAGSPQAVVPTSRRATNRMGHSAVAAAPGGPRHVMLDDERAEHVPGCNLAVRREVLDAIGGFDVRYETAGDDVDLCFRILDAGHEIGFHPGALVWHRRRSTTRAFLRQQRGYGRAEAIVAERHPERCTADRAPRFHGRVYASVRPAGRVYRGPYGSAAFQSIYGGGDDLIDVAHHVGVPTAAALGFAGLLCGFLVPVDARVRVRRDLRAAHARARRLSPMPAASRARARSTAPRCCRGAVPPAADRTDVGATQRAGYEER